METESVINGSHKRKVQDLMTSLPSSIKKNFKKKEKGKKKIMIPSYKTIFIVMPTIRRI